MPSIAPIGVSTDRQSVDYLAARSSHVNSSRRLLRRTPFTAVDHFDGVYIWPSLGTETCLRRCYRQQPGAG